MSVKFTSKGLADGTDSTKELEFNVSGITTGTTRTINVTSTGIDVTGTVTADGLETLHTSGDVGYRLGYNSGASAFIHRDSATGHYLLQSDETGSSWKIETDNGAGPITRAEFNRYGALLSKPANGYANLDTSANLVSIASGGNFNFPASSGMIVVNNHATGSIAVFVTGGGATTIIGSVGTGYGSMAYITVIAGYRWTSNYAGTANYTFTFIRTRPTA